MIRAAVITVSDKGSRGEREDLSGPEAVRLLEAQAIEVVCILVVPDETDDIKNALIDCADRQELDLIITTGGPGVTPRDVTPDATREVLEKEIPGMAEAMRQASMAKTPHAMISRALAGLRGKTLIVNLPGSPKGVRENLAVVLPAIPHAIEKIQGSDKDCAS
ncbi:MAG: MogA/MoaB family molybdenum cofactor biosynthesis protein [Syntrophales bacterium]|jgi:molybdenum cofactor synthesis domain-containing protein|nr:MogA/MoaB family molybdenum cofactor biosynthesis protein [Syntrophales bacterium]